MNTVRIVIELEGDESDTVVVQVTRKRGQGLAEVSASSAEDAGQAPAEALSTSESEEMEVNDAGPAPDSGEESR